MTDDNRWDNAAEESRKGKGCLAEAKYLLDGGFYNAAVSRAYYAAFHMALALLFLKGLQPKTHRGVIQLLQLHYVEKGLLPPDAGAALAHLETYRELSDYTASADFSEARALDEIARSERFIAVCRPFIERPEQNGRV